MDQEKIVVYIRGRQESDGDEWHAWYRVVLETNNKEENETISAALPVENKTVSPLIARLSQPKFGYEGGWCVNGDNIYWTGGSLPVKGGPYHCVYDGLIRHDIHDKFDVHWQPVTRLKTPRKSPLVASVGRKIAIAGGWDQREDSEYEMEDGDWTRCGEIFDLDTRSLAYLSSDIQEFRPYRLNGGATFFLEDQEEAAQAVYYSLTKGSMLIQDISTGNIVEHTEPDPIFAVYSTEYTQGDQVPLGLEQCPKLQLLYDATTRGASPAPFHNRMFYYFALDSRLYGYHVDLHRWFLSGSLEDQLQQQFGGDDEEDDIVLLLGLPNGNLLLLLGMEPGVFKLLSLSVRTDVSSNTVPTDVFSNTLYVKVEGVQYFRPHNPQFRPRDGRSIRLKNTGSGTTRG